MPALVRHQRVSCLNLDMMLPLSADGGVDHTIGEHEFNTIGLQEHKVVKPAACIASRKHQLGHLDFQNAAGFDLVVLYQDARKPCRQQVESDS